jgi:hypothetical protein
VEQENLRYESSEGGRGKLLMKNFSLNNGNFSPCNPSSSFARRLFREFFISRFLLPFSFGGSFYAMQHMLRRRL